jgi:O-antigen/teichoic acid export membrane protein
MILSFLSIMGVIGGIVLFVLSDLIVRFFQMPSLSIYLRWFSILIPLTIISSTFLSFLRAHEKIGWYSFMMNVVQTVSKFILLVILIYWGIKEESVIFSTLLGVAIMLLGSYFAVKWSLPHIFSTSSPQPKILYKVFSYSWPLLILGVIALVNFWADSFALGYYYTATEVGLYNAAVPLALLLLLVPDLFMQLFFPMITREFAKKRFATIKELGKQITKWIVILNMPLFLILFIFPGTFLNLLFDSRYLAAETALRFLALASLLSSLTIVPTILISMLGKSRLVLANTIITLILNIILNACLVPQFGMTGAAIATLIANIFLYGLALFQVNRLLQFIPLRRKIFNILGVSFILMILLYLGKELLSRFVTLDIVVLGAMGFIFLTSYSLLIYFCCLDDHDNSILTMFKEKVMLSTRFLRFITLDYN